MIDLSQTKRVLAIFAHPDDETLAAGGTLSKLSRLGAEIRVVIPATGIHARKNKKTQAEQSAASGVLSQDCQKALGHLGIDVDNIVLGDFPDNEMDSVSLLSVIHWLEPHFESFNPDLVLTHYRGCTNVDHRVCHEAVTVLARPNVGCQIPVLTGEVPSSTGYRRPAVFEPNVYVELSEEDVSNKINSMESYTGEARPDPHPRSAEVLRALAKVRGSESGYMWAEAFMLLRGFA
ncbi:MAG: PIG-L family deacetylase [Magnetovibrio sp.]|nr:PIG-L family deacetylase [Magnetovibrio sp.]